MRRVRAGLPEGWVAGDKTGTSGLIGGKEYNYIDIGFAEGPKGEAPITFACYLRARQTEDDMLPAAEAVLAEVGRIIKEFAEPEKGLPLVGKVAAGSPILAQENVLRHAARAATGSATLAYAGKPVDLDKIYRQPVEAEIDGEAITTGFKARSPQLLSASRMPCSTKVFNATQLLSA